MTPIEKIQREHGIVGRDRELRPRSRCWPRAGTCCWRARSASARRRWRWPCAGTSAARAAGGRRRPLHREQAHGLVRPGARAQARLRARVLCARPAGGSHAPRRGAVHQRTQSHAGVRAERAAARTGRALPDRSAMGRGARQARASRSSPRRIPSSTSPPATSRKRSATASSTWFSATRTLTRRRASSSRETGCGRSRARPRGGGHHARHAGAPRFPQGRVGPRGASPWSPSRRHLAGPDASAP